MSDSETVLSVTKSVCERLSLDPSNCALIFNNVTLDPSAVFLNVVNPGPPVIVQQQNEDSEEEDEGSSDLDGSTLDLFDNEPESEEQSMTYTPANFDVMIANLMDLGPYSREEAEHALRVSYFNIDRAAGFLVQGNVPESRASYIYDDIERALDGGQSTAGEKEVLRRLFNKTKVDIPLLVQYYAACDHDEEETLRCILDEKESEKRARAALDLSDGDEI